MERQKYVPLEKVKNKSRRDFLKSAGMIALGGAITVADFSLVRYALEYRSSNVPETTAPRNPTLQAVEDRRGIELVDLSPQETRYLQSTNPSHPITPLGWDDDRALMVDQFLPFLPDFFYAPNNWGKVRFTLVDEEDACGCQASYTPELNIVTLDPHDFTLQDMVNSFETLTHELTHYTTQTKYFQESPEIDEILGGSFDQKRREYLNTLLTAHIRYLPEMKGFAGYLQYGLSKPFPSEFVPVISQFYTHGRDIFDEYMSAVFGRKKADDLYVYIGDNIFRGKEYDRFPIVVR